MDAFEELAQQTEDALNACYNAAMSSPDDDAVEHILHVFKVRALQNKAMTLAIALAEMKRANPDSANQAAIDARVTQVMMLAVPLRDEVTAELPNMVGAPPAAADLSA